MTFSTKFDHYIPMRDMPTHDWISFPVLCSFTTALPKLWHYIIQWKVTFCCKAFYVTLLFQHFSCLSSFLGQGHHSFRSINFTINVASTITESTLTDIEYFIHPNILNPSCIGVHLLLPPSQFQCYSVTALFLRKHHPTLSNGSKNSTVVGAK